jgi:hypothetical protein
MFSLLLRLRPLRSRILQAVLNRKLAATRFCTGLQRTCRFKENLFWAAQAQLWPSRLPQ